MSDPASIRARLTQVPDPPVTPPGPSRRRPRFRRTRIRTRPASRRFRRSSRSAIRLRVRTKRRT